MPNSFGGWLFFLLVPRLPKSVEALLKKIPINKKAVFWVVFCLFSMPTVVLANPITDWGKQVIWGWIAELESFLATKAFEGLKNLLFSPTNINQFPTVKTAVQWSQGIALSLLTLAAIWEFLQIMGLKSLGGNDKPVVDVIKGAIMGVFFIVFLPWSVFNLFIPANNYLLEAVSTLGVGVKTNILIFLNPLGPGNPLVIIMLVFVIAALILAVSSGIRYVEIIMCTVVAPIVAVSVIRTGDALQVWVRETVAIIFTQCVQLLLLNLLGNFIGTDAFWGGMMAIGVVVVLLRGPQVIRQFLYSSGSGNYFVAAAGNAGRMAAFKMMAKMAGPKG